EITRELTIATKIAPWGTGASRSDLAPISTGLPATGGTRRPAEASPARRAVFRTGLADIRHEIRPRLGAVVGTPDLVLDTPLTEDQRQCLQAARSAADNLLEVVNDLLDFSKVQAGKRELSPADFSRRSTPGDTLRALAARAHRKGLERWAVGYSGGGGMVAV